MKPNKFFGQISNHSDKSEATGQDFLKIKPNKLLGQNFLKSKKIINDIIFSADLKEKDIVLEIGSGKGILTEELLKKSKKVIAVEKDIRLTGYLEEKFKGIKNLEIIHDDILKLDISKLKINNLKFKIVSNIPYYITSRLLRKFLESNFQPSKIVLMVQKEVAVRIIARNKKESILSISVKAYGNPKIIKKVPARYFSPKPKVDSAILLIDNISKNFFKEINEKSFFGLIKKGSSHKRKLLKNNLKISEEILKKCKISKNVRAEELSLGNWKCLYEKTI